MHLYFPHFTWVRKRMRGSEWETIGSCAKRPSLLSRGLKYRRWEHNRVDRLMLLVTAIICVRDTTFFRRHFNQANNANDYIIF